MLGGRKWRPYGLLDRVAGDLRLSKGVHVRLRVLLTIELEIHLGHAFLGELKFLTKTKNLSGIWTSLAALGRGRRVRIRISDGAGAVVEDVLCFGPLAVERGLLLRELGKQALDRVVAEFGFLFVGQKETRADCMRFRTLGELVGIWLTTLDEVSGIGIMLELRFRPCCTACVNSTLWMPRRCNKLTCCPVFPATSSKMLKDVAIFFFIGEPLSAISSCQGAEKEMSVTLSS